MLVYESEIAAEQLRTAMPPFLSRANSRRRRFIVETAALIGLTLCRTASGAPPRVIGFLAPDSEDSESGQQVLVRLPAALAKHGHVVGNDIRIEWRWGNGDSHRLTEAAAELVRAHVDLIVARNNSAVITAMALTQSIPIVMLNGNFPLETGLVENLARPGHNVTGTSYMSVETVGKELQLLREVAPRIRRVGVLTSGPSSDRGRFEAALRGALRTSAATLGLDLEWFGVSGPEDVHRVLDAVARSKVDSIIYVGTGQIRGRAATTNILRFLRDHKLPSVSVLPSFADNGGLVCYSPEVEEFFARTAAYVDRVLSGASPADLPVDEPTKFELVVNLKTAREIGLEVPQAILLRATRLVQ